MSSAAFLVPWSAIAVRDAVGLEYRFMAESSATAARETPGRRTGLGLLVLAWGVQAIIAQSLLLREALVLMFGSEFAWGVVLFAWLMGVALGATAGGRLSRRWAAGAAATSQQGHGGRSVRADVALVAVLVALSVSVPIELWVFRGARAWLGVQPGELLPLGRSAIAAVLFVSPVSALVGMAFPLACSVSPSPGGVPSARSRAADGGPATSERSPSVPLRQAGAAGRLGRVYALESLGSLLGGAAFTFWAVEHLRPIQTALLCGAITLGASGFLLAASHPGRWMPRRPGRRAALLLGGLAGMMVAVSVYAGDDWNRRLVERRWRTVAPGYALCAEAESKYQNLAVGRRAGQYTLYCDGQATTDFPDPYTFVPLAHFWMCEHPSPRQVLVLGGGAEGLLAEILRHPVEHVDYVEPDPRQIELIAPFLAEADRRALSDARVRVHHLDARYFVKTQRGRFDLVIARLPEPTSALRARFYTDEFYGELRRAMSPRAVLCTTAAAAPTSLGTEAAAYLASIRASLRRHFPLVIVGWGDPAQIIAATADGLASTDPEELARRYQGRNVRSAMFDPAWFAGATDWLEPAKLQQRAAELDRSAIEVSTDLRPVVYLQRLILWERMTSGRSGRTLAYLRGIGVGRLTILFAATAGAVVLLFRVRDGPRCGWTSGAIVLSVGATGFATMALSMIWLFAFQNLYGYVYQRIGWIIAMFMGGLVIGCATGGRRARRHERAANNTRQGPASYPCASPGYLWRRLIGVDLLIAVLALLAPIVLPALGAAQGGRFAFVLVEWTVSIFVGATGVLCGAAFTIAGGLLAPAAGGPAGSQEAGGLAGAAAGSVVGADHAGACLGALLTGVLLVPVLGTATAALFLVAIKASSAALLAMGRRLSRAV